MQSSWVVQDFVKSTIKINHHKSSDSLMVAYNGFFFLLIVYKFLFSFSYAREFLLFFFFFCYSLIILPDHMEMFLKIAKLSQDQKQMTGVMQ